MTTLLDTQVLLTIGLEGIEKLPGRVRRLVADVEVTRCISAVSVTEIAIKARIGKIIATADSVSQMIADLKLDIIPYAPRHAMRLFELPLHHCEPFDRMLIATAITENIPLVSGDEHFPAYKPQGLTVIWN